MARRKQAQKANISDQPDPDLLKHIDSLGLKSVGKYLDWCGQHGFSRRTNKHWRQQLKERAFLNRAVADTRLVRKKSELRRPEQAIEEIFQGELQEDAITEPRLRAIWQVCKSSQHAKHAKQEFRRLLQHLSGRSELLATEPVVPELGRHDHNSFIGGLIALARFSYQWLRPIEGWRPRSHNARRQFSSLARHLLANWPVPAFMDAVWFKGTSPEAIRQQKWFLHLGGGGNLRTVDLPLPYTKRMAHHFMQAPSDSSVEAALRWGQIHAMGGNERLVRAVAGTRLGSSFEHDGFWITVLKFLIANPNLDMACVGPIVDYLHCQKFMTEETIVAPGVAERRGPTQPNLSMKGRTTESLLRHVAAWHRQLAKTEQPVSDWAPSGFNGYEFVEGTKQSGNLKIWTITELLSTKALYAEGRTLKHCVASYAGSCARGRSAIWTLEVLGNEGRQKVLTVELNLGAQLICQARGKCNASPSDKHRSILRRWAEQEGLRLADHV